MKTLFAGLLLICCSFQASADVPAPALYSCRVILTAEDLGTGGGDWNFTTVNGGTHGGTPFQFVKGAHDISVIADQQWLGVSWLRAGKKVAEAEFVVGPSDQPAFKVGILVDPAHEEDQLAVSCEKK